MGNVTYFFIFRYIDFIEIEIKNYKIFLLFFQNDNILLIASKILSNCTEINNKSMILLLFI